ncbi:cryptochrome [Acrodontium crateriforme]|uniref:Cryptochrome DASH n=1 Tax=Acrodontium crateriforme TaxID=150365 RepID=A0AAQ3R718_9PEZI|nr:cryptochrome [Acrodontium crateriforme]
MSQVSRVLVYLVRRDLRIADNPVLHEISRLNTQSTRPFTHLLPVYIFPANQIEVSGFLARGEKKSPYPEARSAVGGFWRCGKHRSKFIAESVWDLKQDLEGLGSGLEIRVGSVKDVLSSILAKYRQRTDVELHGLWMTSEESWEELQEEEIAQELAQQNHIDFKLWNDEKYFIDDRDLPHQQPSDLSDVFTTFRKTVEPLRNAPRKELPRPKSLPALPEFIPPQDSPFAIPTTLKATLEALHKPLTKDVVDIPSMPEGVESAHPFTGGSKAALERVRHLIEAGAMTAYKDTRNGLLGLNFSTKLSAWLSLGCLTARQVHWQLMDFEDGKGEVGKSTAGYGKGESNGTTAVRFELLWRDYMRLCTRKFHGRLFYLGGYRQQSEGVEPPRWKKPDAEILRRFLAGETGIGLIDASQRELLMTGWTSNRARQNVASFLAKHLGLDWRLGAEWYESQLIDYDVSSNWGNWQYVAGVGNDPRGAARVFNPVKQALDYDPKGEYIRAWVPELRGVGETDEDLLGVFQAWRLPQAEKKRLGLAGLNWVDKPLKRIDFSLNRRGGRGGRGEGGRGRGRGGGGRGRGRGDGREARSGPMEKAGWKG